MIYSNVIVDSCCFAVTLPLASCGSEKSSFTLMWYMLATCWIASNVDAPWEHPALSCLKYTQFTSSGIAVLSCFKTSSMIARTVTLSWLQLSRICRNISIWGWPSEFLKTVVVCHEIPRLPNQSDWLSWYFRGRYLVSHSKTRSIECLATLTNPTVLYLSWLIWVNELSTLQFFVSHRNDIFHLIFRSS